MTTRSPRNLARAFNCAYVHTVQDGSEHWLMLVRRWREQDVTACRSTNEPSDEMASRRRPF